MSEQPNIHGDSRYNIKSNEMSNQNRSVKYSNKMNKASVHSISTHDDRNDMIEDIPKNKKKEVVDDVKDIQNIENDDHETMGRYEKTNSESKSATSSIQQWRFALQHRK